MINNYIKIFPKYFFICLFLTDGCNKVDFSCLSVLITILRIFLSNFPLQKENKIITLTLCIIRCFSVFRHRRKGVISSTLVLEISKLSKTGRSSAINSKQWRLNSVSLTLSIWRFRSLERATTTQYLINKNKIYNL